MHLLLNVSTYIHIWQINCLPSLCLARLKMTFRRWHVSTENLRCAPFFFLTVKAPEELRSNNTSLPAPLGLALPCRQPRPASSEGWPKAGDPRGGAAVPAPFAPAQAKCPKGQLVGAENRQPAPLKVPC